MVEVGSKNEDLTLRQLDQIIAEFEDKYWDGPKDTTGKTLHLFLHLGKLVGKLATPLERADHRLEPDFKQVDNEVIPDLLYYALALAKLRGVDPQAALLQRLEDNKVRVAAWVDKRDGTHSG